MSNGEHFCYWHQNEASSCEKLPKELEKRLEEAKPVYHLRPTYVLDENE